VRIVLDTNIIVSGLISPSGPPARLLDLWDEDQLYTLISAEEQIVELMRVVDYPKLRARLRPGLVHDWVFTLRRFGLLLADLPTVNVSPDPNDNFLLAIAQAGRADLLVTGDKRDLLALKSHGGTAIVSAREAVARLQGGMA
jgi:putative PIN family toxin of toxin-antitoxin system